MSETKILTKTQVKMVSAADFMRLQNEINLFCGALKPEYFVSDIKMSATSHDAVAMIIYRKREE